MNATTQTPSFRCSSCKCAFPHALPANSTRWTATRFDRFFADAGWQSAPVLCPTCLAPPPPVVSAQALEIQELDRQIRAEIRALKEAGARAQGLPATELFPGSAYPVSFGGVGYDSIEVVSVPTPAPVPPPVVSAPAPPPVAQPVLSAPWALHPVAQFAARRDLDALADDCVRALEEHDAPAPAMDLESLLSSSVVARTRYVELDPDEQRRAVLRARRAA